MSAAAPAPSRLSPTGWVTLEKLAQQGIWLVLFVVLAPVLGPKPYGLFSLTMVVVGFCELVIVEAGAEALLTLHAPTDAHVRTANLANLLAGLFAAAATAACAVPVAAAFRAPELKPLFLAMAALPVMSACVGSPTAALKREMRFRPFALRSILGLSVGGAVGIAAAFAGAGVWALAAQTLVQRAVEVVTLWSAAPGSLRLGWSREAAGEMRACAANVFAARALMWFTGQVPRVIVGALLGPTVLGLFTLATRIVDMLVQVVLAPATQVARVELTRYAGRLEGLPEAFRRLLREMALYAFPVGVGLAAVAPTLFGLWLGPRWAGADTATEITALTLLVQPVYYATSATLLAVRRSHLDTGVQALLGASAVAATLVGARWGLAGVCLALLLRLALLSVLPLVMLRRAGGVEPWPVVRAPFGPLAAALLMGAVVRLAQGPVDAWAGRLLSLPLLVALGAATYLAAAWRLAPADARRALDALRATLRLRRPAAVASSAGGC